MIRDLAEDEELVIPENGKFAAVFHMPGHCAGCKRAISILEKINSPEWNIVLIDSDNDAFRPLIQSYNISSAPTIVCWENGQITKEIRGLKEFLENQKMFE